MLYDLIFFFSLYFKCAFRGENECLITYKSMDFSLRPDNSNRSKRNYQSINALLPVSKVTFKAQKEGAIEQEQEGCCSSKTVGSPERIFFLSLLMCSFRVHPHNFGFPLAAGVASCAVCQ